MQAIVTQSQIFCPATDPLSRGARRPKFNQLEMVTTFTYRPTGENRCTQYRVIVVTDAAHHKHRLPVTDRTDYNTLHR